VVQTRQVNLKFKKF